MAGNGRTAEAQAPHPTVPRGLAKFLSAYRGNLSRTEAARRSGLPEARWREVETAAGQDVPEAPGPVVSPNTVAAMCVAVGADVATGLKLAGHDPQRFDHLLASPPRLLHMRAPLAPCIVSSRAVADAEAIPGIDPRPLIAEIFRDAADTNRRLAERIAADPPDARAEYWSGYADALRALAREQAEVADTESP